MAKVEIKAQGTIPGCVNDLVTTMLQHEGIKEIVVQATMKYTLTQALRQKAAADVAVDRMKGFIRGGN